MQFSITISRAANTAAKYSWLGASACSDAAAVSAAVICSPASTLGTARASSRATSAKLSALPIAEILETQFPDVEPRLLPALARLSEQQRTVVVLVHGYGWRQAEVARLLSVNASTVRDYLNRALDRLREELEVSDVNSPT